MRGDPAGLLRGRTALRNDPIETRAVLTRGHLSPVLRSTRRRRLNTLRRIQSPPSIRLRSVTRDTCVRPRARPRVGVRNRNGMRSRRTQRRENKRVSPPGSNHASNLFDKLGVWSRAQALVFARDQGFNP
jgi:hypothetical protein